MSPICVRESLNRNRMCVEGGPMSRDASPWFTRREAFELAFQPQGALQTTTGENDTFVSSKLYCAAPRQAASAAGAKHRE